MDVGTILLYYVLHILCTAGLFCIFGGAIAVCNRLFYSSIGNKSKVLCYATGFIGTPIHELSHALMCLIFGHKIIEIKLFQINSADGVLGYVKHSYNPKNIYQRVGNFFIGIAPVIVGFIILTGLFRLLLPDVYDSCAQNFTAAGLTSGVRKSFNVFFATIVQLLRCFDRWQFWVFIIIGGLIALHMTLSKADWNGASSGVIAYLFVFAVADLIVALIAIDLFNAFTAEILAFAAFVTGFGLLFIALILIGAAITAIILKLARKNR